MVVFEYEINLLLDQKIETFEKIKTKEKFLIFF